MDLVPFIEDHSKGLKNFAKGVQLEKRYAQYFHSVKEAVPLLISAKFLRSRQCGQIDIAYYYKGIIYLVEVKSSLRYSRRQQIRLHRAARLLSTLFNRPIILKYCFYKKE